MTINGEQIETYSDMSKTSVFLVEKRTASFPWNVTSKKENIETFETCFHLK